MAAARTLIVLALLGCVSDFQTEDGTYACASDADCLDARFCDSTQGCVAVQVPNDCRPEEIRVTPCTGTLAGGSGKLPAVAIKDHLSFAAAGRLTRIDAEGRCLEEQPLPAGAEAHLIDVGPGDRPVVAGLLEGDLFVWRAGDDAPNRLALPADSTPVTLSADEVIRVGLLYQPAPTVERSLVAAVNEGALSLGDPSFSDPRGCELGGLRTLACRGPRCAPFAVVGRAKCRGPSLDGHLRFEFGPLGEPALRGWDLLDDRVVIDVNQIALEDAQSVVLAGRLFDVQSGHEASCVVWRARWGDLEGDEILGELPGQPCWSLREVPRGHALVGGTESTASVLWLTDQGSTTREVLGPIQGGAIAGTGIVWLLRWSATGVCLSHLEPPGG